MKNKRKVIATVLSVLILLAMLPCTIFAQQAELAPLQIGVVSDIHYYSSELKGGNCEAFMEYCQMNSTGQNDQSEALLESALAALEEHAETNGMKYVIIPGDLTVNGEYVGHTKLAERLEQFEEDTGIQVIVINGNHDINNSGAFSYANGVRESARKTTPEEFLSIYADLGYDLAYHTFTPPEGEKAGMLSYSVKLDGGYRLIAMDGGKYSSDNTSDGEDEHETSGNYSEALREWIFEEMADAKANGEIVIGLTHFNFVDHGLCEEEILQSFVVDDCEVISEQFADAGMRYVFTGHFHRNDVASRVSDDGETIYDIAAGSLTSYPNTFKEVLFDNTAGEGKVTAELRSYAADCVQKVVYNGETIEDYEKYSFNFSYGNGDAKNLAMNYVKLFLTDILDDAQEAGGLLAYLEKSGIDVEELLGGYIGDGFGIPGVVQIDMDNFMGLIEDLAGQLDERYINDPEHTMEVLEDVIEKVLSFEVSQVPCTKFIDTLGFGDAEKPGTFGDMVLCCFYYLDSGEQDISDDAFIQDVIYQMENGDTAERLIDTLIQVLLHDLIEDELLSNIDLNIRAFFPDDDFTKYVGIALDILLNAILLCDTSLMNIVDFAFALPFVPYGSLQGILDHLMDEYFTQSQYESIGYTLAKVVRSLCIDTNPGENMDNNATLAYNGPVTVVPTTDTYRLPSNIAVTVGTDADTTRNINWYTKWSVVENEIQIVPYSETPDFSNGTTVDVEVAQTDTETTLEYPGVDFGIFGLITYEFPVVRHTAKITGLEAGEKYCYRLGNSERNWWSDTGVLKMADNSEEFTFLHVSDAQSQNALQYETWANVLDTAFDMFPETELVVNTGDFVDNGDNANQWKWMFNVASDSLINTVLMPTAGNHEDKGEFALDRNFALSNVPAQDTKTGVYYSFDYNNVHFMVINSNNLSPTEGLSDEQISWLSADATASDAMWKVVAIHKAPYSNGSHFDDDDVSAIRDQLSVLMPDLGIDLVLQGHDHVYMRTDVLDNNEVIETKTAEINYDEKTYTAKIEPQGTIYVISACAGVKNYIQKDVSLTDGEFPRAESTVVTENPVFSSIHINGNSLYFDAYAVGEDGTERIDSFAILKDCSPEEKPKGPEWEEPETPVETKPTDVEDNPAEETPVKETSPDTGDNTIVVAIAIIPLAFSMIALISIKRKRKSLVK